jgi:hypothetical protein
MRKSLLIVIIGATVGIAILGIFAYKMYNKPHVDVKNSEVMYDMYVDDLMEAFKNAEAVASEKYNGEVVVISGIFRELNTTSNGLNYIIIEGKEGVANCEMESLSNNFSEERFKNRSIRLKGICVGYDDLLEELQLKKCSIVGS